MGELGNLVLNAMREQGWMVIFGETAGVWLCAPPNDRPGHIIPATCFEEGNEPLLRKLLLPLITFSGLQWPWPPDHHEWLHGEVPLHE